MLAVTTDRTVHEVTVIRDAVPGAQASPAELFFYSRDGGTTVDVSFGTAPGHDVPGDQVFAVDLAGEPLRPFDASPS